ncbi:MAG: saccharopine dehydrogenase NADP-binding domain-containing protein [Deltaproteobacteria bacterium]|nr:saccharopine dehydrogenase NADP-binding domain-containing protein [Deltaproteobacteria bacterium]
MPAKDASEKSVLVLGAGLVVRPLLDELFARPNTSVTVAALNIDRARQLVEGHSRGRAVELDSSDRARLHEEVGRADAVVSLLPATLHVPVAKACLEHRVPLVTSSYVSDEMRALDQEAQSLGVLLLNETGLDPGIDHMMAAEVIRRVRKEGEEILAFASYAGGLPAPANNDNPWGYKLSWSPRAVLVSARSHVQYREGGEVHQFPHPYHPGAVRSLEVPRVGKLEVYPTRDSLKYQKPYRLEHLKDLFRGTLRYPGWCATLRSLLELDLLSLEPIECKGLTYRSLLAQRLAAPAGDVETKLAAHLGVEPGDDIIERFSWLGLLSDRALPEQPTAPLDLVATLFQDKLQYAPGEQDLVILEHHFIATRSGGGRRKIVKRLQVFGTAGDHSAMALTVGTPAGLACGLILDGKISLTGVRIPVSEELTVPILRGLEERGFAIEEVEEDLT